MVIPLCDQERGLSPGFTGPESAGDRRILPTFRPTIIVIAPDLTQLVEPQLFQENICAFERQLPRDDLSHGHGLIHSSD